MAGLADGFERFVDELPKKNSKKKRWMDFFVKWVLVPFWAWRTPVKPQPGGPHYSVQPGDNVQHMMNLIMPLKNKSAAGRAEAALAIAQNKDEIYAGVHN